MKRTASAEKTEKIELSGKLAEFREALEQELAAIEKSGQSSMILTNGRKLEQQSAGVRYHFNVEYTPNLPPDTPCKLFVGNEPYNVTVVSYDNSLSIIIRSEKPLPPALGSVRLETGVTVLIERLIQCIETESQKNNPVGNRMFLQGDGSVYQSKRVSKVTPPRKQSLCDSQYNAIVSAIQNDITFIWGPPGTGKTTVIGEILMQLFIQNRSVLVVSHTNTAVDGAIERAIKGYDNLSASKHSPEREFPVLRLGSAGTLKDQRVSLEYHKKQLGQDLVDKEKRVTERKTKVDGMIKEINFLFSLNEWIKNSKIPELNRQNALLRDFNSRRQKLLSEVNYKEKQLQASMSPDYKKYQETKKQLEQVRDEQALDQRSCEDAKATVEEISLKINSADDEIKKHTLYAELKLQEERLMSEQFLLGEIGRIREKKKELESQIAQATAVLSKCTDTISKYQSKGSFAKLFASKSTFENAQQEKIKMDAALNQFRSEVRIQEHLQAEYEKQLESLHILQMRRKAIEPKKTVAYWRDQKRALEKQMLIAKDEFGFRNNRVKKAAQRIAELNATQAKLRGTYDRIVKLEQENESLQAKLRQLEGDKEKCEAEFSSLLQQELSLCAEFISEGTIEAISHRYSEAKKKLGSINLNEKQQEKKRLSDELGQINKELSEIREKMALLEQQAILNAKIIGATLTKTYCDSQLRSRTFDTVILDEASMAAIPALWCASYLADKNIIIVGDFLQLPPIVISDDNMAKKWLGRDIFDHSGMQEAARQKKTPKNFIMLNQQFRMEKDIAELANMYYGEYCELKTGDADLRRTEESNSFYEWYNGKRTKDHIHLIDTESLHAWVTGVKQGRKSHSRLNFFSAAVVVDMAFNFLENKLKDLKSDIRPSNTPYVLIVAPYKPHVKLVQELINLEYKNRGFKHSDDLNLIAAGTIHSFQGKEADIVIFDLVIDEPHWKASLFMTEPEINKGIERMINVAVTRAKFQLFIVGNFAYCQKRAKNNALSNLLEKLIDEKKLPKIDAKALLPRITFYRKNTIYQSNEVPKYLLCNDADFDKYFEKDLLSFTKQLVIYSPFMTENRISQLLPVMSDSIRAGKRIIIVTKAHSDRKSTELSYCLKCEEELQSIGVTVLHKQGMHEKVIFFDDSVVWAGSLNELSFTGLTGEFMHRFEGTQVREAYEKILDFRAICDVADHEYMQRCPICGKEMLLKDGADGGCYWQCIEKDYSRQTDQSFPADGIFRCSCGEPYVFSMKTEPRWICPKDPKHKQQKMKENDLKLTKMAALIPKNRMPEVRRYFQKKRSINGNKG